MFSGRMQHTPASLQAPDPWFWASLLLLWEWGAVFPPLILPPGNLCAPCLRAMDHFPAETVVFFWALTPHSPAAESVAHGLVVFNLLSVFTHPETSDFFSSKLCYFSPCPCLSLSPLSLLPSSVCVSFSFLLLLNPPGIRVRMPTTLWWEVAVVLNLHNFCLVNESLTVYHGIIFMVLAIHFCFVRNNYQRFPGGQCRRCRRPGFDCWVGKMPWSRKWHPLQCSCPENPMDRGAWRAAVQGVTKSQTRQKRLSTAQHTHTQGIATMVTEYSAELNSGPVPTIF